MHDKTQIFISQISGQTTKKKKKKTGHFSAYKLNTQASQKLNIMSRNELGGKKKERNTYLKTGR